MISAFLHGIILSFGLILPLGVQNVFVFNQGARQRSYFKALPVVLTAAVCDTLLIVAAVAGVSLIVLTFAWLQTALYGFGFIFLIYMGWVIWTSKPSKLAAQPINDSRKQILFAVSVSLMNPHAILDTLGIIGTNSLAYVGGDKWAFTLSVILVSWLWFFGLAYAGRLVGKRDTTGIFIAKINKVSACMIWGVAIYMGLH
ncbi:LysE/ArgO family amino acid transporter [Paenibacillus alba]|uniref:LysE/ArgO family amino acid transporter n=1 Tax=Paenibacillus alba TaxID=1197127 RepID=A0ABU6G8I9_9BACL|nr:LysE/ArgO family amino acid transporter [Paenibacillus alba]MEC0230511.1 LysE/ArgO family amino acid transporter [Paenibacillus alba]